MTESFCSANFSSSTSVNRFRPMRFRNVTDNHVCLKVVASPDVWAAVSTSIIEPILNDYCKDLNQHFADIIAKQIMCNFCSNTVISCDCCGNFFNYCLPCQSLADYLYKHPSHTDEVVCEQCYKS